MLNPPCSLKLVLNIPKYVESSFLKTPKTFPQNPAGASSKWCSSTTKNLLNLFLKKIPRTPHQNPTCVDLPSSKNGVSLPILLRFSSLLKSGADAPFSQPISGCVLLKPKLWWCLSPNRNHVISLSSLRKILVLISTQKILVLVFSPKNII